MIGSRGAPPTLGVFTSGTPAEVAALEALPTVRALWVGGHVAGRRPVREVVTTLAALASATERVLVGSSVLVLPLYQPAIAAKQLAQIDLASDGRLVVGVGVGGDEPEDFRAAGVPVTERGPRTDEAVDLLRALWSGDRVDHRGPFHELHAVHIRPAPAQRGGPPLVLAGRRGRALRRAALTGDGWMPYLMSPERYAAASAEVEEIRSSAGLDSLGYGWHLFLVVDVDDDGAAAERAAAERLARAFGPRVAARAAALSAAGDAEAVAMRLQSYVDAGARHIIAVPSRTERVVKIAQRLAEDVWPLLLSDRGATGACAVRGPRAPTPSATRGASREHG